MDSEKFRDMTKEELYEMATEKGVPSISHSMTKEELIAALENFRGPGEPGSSPSQSTQGVTGS